MNEVKFWRYHVPSIDGEGWGKFIIDSTGMFAAVTDYGNAAYQFHISEHMGVREHFAKGVSASLMEKLFYDLRRYDGDETLLNVKQEILRERRRGKTWTREMARQEWDRLSDYEDLDTQYQFHLWYQETRVYDSGRLFTLSYPHSCRAFINKLMPRLCEMIREELKKEEGDKHAV